MMSCIKNHLEVLKYEIESQLKPNLQGFIGKIVRGYLPQNWTFMTEQDMNTLSIDINGNVTVISGKKSPDVIIQINHYYLSEVLRTKQQPSFKPERFNVTPLNRKGESAFTFLKGYFGL